MGLATDGAKVWLLGPCLFATIARNWENKNSVDSNGASFERELGLCVVDGGGGMAATASPFSRTYLILALAALAPALLLSSTPPANRAPTQTLHRGGASPTSRAPTNVRGGATAVKPPPERLECRELGLRDGLLKQHDELLKQHGERLTIMCVGEAGLGKSSLISNIFTLPIGPAQSLKQTKEISKTVLNLKSDGIPLTVTFVDTPGYCDQVELQKEFKMITNHIDKRLRDTFNNEKRNGAKNMEFPAELGKDPVDVVLFFISPHRLKGVDIEFLRHIQGRCSIIPILAKADTMTKDELTEFRSMVTTKLAEEGIEYYQGPYAVISAPLYNSSEYGQPGQPGGRVYPWGTAQSDNEGHSDLPSLRRRLVTEGLNDLKANSKVFYAKYRERALKWHRGWRGLARRVAEFAIAHAAVAIAAGYRPKQVHEAEHAISCMLYLKKLELQGKLPTPPWEKPKGRKRPSREMRQQIDHLEEMQREQRRLSNEMTYWGWEKKRPSHEQDLEGEKAGQKWGLWSAT